MLSLDTEDNTRGQPWIIDFFDGQSHYTFQGIRCQVEAWNWLEKRPKEIIWACNAEYDLLNLFGEFTGKLATMQYVSAGFLRARLAIGGHTVLDTLRHWPASVKKMGQVIGLPKIETDDYINVDYCRRDAEIVWFFVEAMVKRYTDLGLELKATLPSMALQFWKRLGGSSEPDLSEAEMAWLRRGYYGGRVEVYQLGKVNGPIYNYDYNSLFPSVMKGFQYPRLESMEWTKKPQWDREGMADIEIFSPLTNFPILPQHGQDELFYPWGSMRGVWTYVEIRYALENGCRIKKIYEACEFLDSYLPFDNYVNFCYNQRLAVTDELDKMFWKLFLNSLYGKFAQWGGIETIHKDRQIVLNGKAKHVNVIWSAYVTSYARIKLHQALASCSKVYYTDTDSLFTPDVLETSAKIGELKLEGKADSMDIVGNKIYMYGDKAKAKGVPQDKAKEFIRTGRAVYRRPVRFRMSRASFLRPNYWTEFNKSLCSTYTKRRVQPDGLTVPWEFKAYQLEVMKKGESKNGTR